MAKQSIRISLNAAAFPFLYRDTPRTVIVPGLDVNVKWPTYFGNQDNADWGNPQMIFCENILPIANGYISTKTAQLISAPLSGAEIFTGWGGTSSVLYSSEVVPGTLLTLQNFDPADATTRYKGVKVSGLTNIQATSINAIPGAAVISAQIGQTTKSMGVVLQATDPTAAYNVANVIAGFLLSNVSTYTIVENGAVVLGPLGYNSGDHFRVEYSAGSYKYYKNSTLLRTSAVFDTRQILFGNFWFFAEATGGATFTNMVYNAPIVWDQIIPMRDAAENVQLCCPAGGGNLLLLSDQSAWQSSAQFTPKYSRVTSATVNGRSFLFYERERLLEYDSTTNSFVDRTSSIVFPAGYSITDMHGISQASNYMTMFGDITVHWSSPSDPLSFNRALNNGSGFQIPQDVRGKITSILPIAGGAVVYTSKNAVAMTFTNNAAAPFVFKGISNSGGVATAEQVASNGSDQYHYTWSTGGLQKVSLLSATASWPELTDFLTSNWTESYDYTNHAVVSQVLGSAFSVKMSYISSRYLAISYGPAPGAYQYAIIFDSALERFGKIKIDHADCFQYPFPGNETLDPTIGGLVGDIAGLGELSFTDLTTVGVLSSSPIKKSIAFLGLDGTITLVYADYTSSSNESVVIIGKIQHNRQRMCTLHQIEVEGIDSAGLIAPRIFDLMSIDGKQISEVREYLAYDVTADATYNNYLGEACAKTHQISFEGAFQLTSLVLQLANHGRAV